MVINMKIQILVLMSILLLVVSIHTIVASSEVTEMLEVYPQTTDDVLLNPGMGLYLAAGGYQPKADAWFMKIADIAYFSLIFKN